MLTPVAVVGFTFGHAEGHMMHEYTCTDFYIIKCIYEVNFNE